ncbi:MAG: PrsW family intramembrane metalloprotease, partial [Candidatus Binatia bacterium]
HAPAPRRWAIALVLCAAVGPTLWFVRFVSDVPGTIVLAAIAPALVYAWLIVQIDRAKPEPWLALLAALLGGAIIAAYLSHTINGWLLTWVGTLASADDARPLAAGFGAPVVEEIAKAGTLLVLFALITSEVDGALDGIVYGALIGMGFAFTENVIYLTFAVLQGGPSGLLQAVYIRALLGGFNHAAFTATTGAALGWAWVSATTRGRWLVPAVGLGLAIIQHVVWNAVASNAINGVLCGPELLGGPCRPHPSETSLLLAVPLLTAIFIGPGIMTLGAITVLSRGRATRRPILTKSI